jgi:hypothetical protein
MIRRVRPLRGARICAPAALAAAAALCLNGCASRASQNSLAEIVARNTQARGGAEAIARAQTVLMRMKIAEPKYTVDGLYRATREGRMRIDVYMEGKRVYSEGYDGYRGWALPADASDAKDSGPEGTAALRHGLEYPTNLWGLGELATRGSRLVYKGREVIDGVNYHVLELVLADRFTTYFYVNPDTWLIERQRDERALHPDADATKKWIERRFSDYRAVEGRQVAFKEEQYELRTHTLLQTTTLTEVETNPRFRPEVFSVP